MTSSPVTPVAPQRPAPPYPVTFEEFLAWADEDTLAEWVDGEVVPMSPSSLDHQRLLLFLYDLLNRYIRAGQLGEVLVAPVLMRLATRPSGREPDLLFVAATHADRLRETYVEGPADLVVEIVSPESDARDHGDKFVEYEAAGIPEYWLIDPLRREALFYQRGTDEHYHAGPIDADGMYHAAVLPGFQLRAAWLWERPLPSVEGLKREIER